MASETFVLPNWSKGPLYTFLTRIFPEHITPYNRLDVQRLRKELNKSHEAVYKWLRSGRLTPDNASALLHLANNAENTAARSAQMVSPNDRFSTLHPVKTSPPSVNNAAPTANFEYTAYACSLADFAAAINS